VKAAVELRHLRYFVAVAEAENVSRAALKLHVSQPPLSRQIRDLEDELGFLLFKRTAKSVSLTEAGRTFLNEARAVLQRADEGVKKARAVATAGETELHVGASYTPAAPILPDIVRACQHALPTVHIKLHDWTHDQTLAGLREGRLQLAFVLRVPKAPPLRDLRFEELLRLQPQLAVAPEHPFARRRSVSLADAAREPFIAFSREGFHDHLDFLARTFAPVTKKLRIVEEVDSYSALISAIEAGTGVALSGPPLGYVAGQRVKLVRLTPEPTPATLGIAALKGRLSPAAEIFWKCAKQAAAQKSLSRLRSA
jgi:LysR family transcriptional regulator, benzoate and cis,cis-muconate-responsive activator of ben and cat genes